MNEYSPGDGAGKATIPKPRQVTLPRTTIAEILILLHNARRRAEANQVEQAIVSLDQIEQLLFQPRAEYLK